MPAEEQFKLKEKVDQYNRQIEDMKKEVRKLNEQFDMQANSKNLYGDYFERESDSSGKQRLLGKNAHLSDQNKQLREAIVIGNDAEI